MQNTSGVQIIQQPSANLPLKTPGWAAAAGNNPCRSNHQRLYKHAWTAEAVAAAPAAAWRLCNLEAVILVYLTVLASENPGGQIKYYVPHKCKGLWGLNHFHLTATGLLLRPRVSHVAFHSAPRSKNQISCLLFSCLCLFNAPVSAVALTFLFFFIAKA